MTSTSSEAPAKSNPLWQMDLRHKLGLTPGKIDLISVLLWHSIAGSTSTPECEQRIENHIEELNRALRIIREDM